MRKQYVIRSGQQFYRWNEQRNDVEWTTLAQAIRWPNRRMAEQVAASNGGKVIQIEAEKRVK